MPVPNDSATPDARAVAGRALILHYEIERVAFTAVTGIMALFGDLASDEEKAEFSGGLDELVSVTIELLKDLRLWSHATPRERRVFETSPDALTPEDQAFVRAEADALVCLLWALGRVESLPESDAPTEGSALSETFASAEDEAELVVAFLNDAALRPEWELAAARDATAARLRKVTQCQSGALSADSATAATVLATRLKALDWICGALSRSEWDDALPQEL